MTKFAKIEDNALLIKVKNGDHQAFAEVVKRNEDRIANVVYGMLGKSSEAEDVGQEVFIRFYKNIDKFRGDSKLSTYLTKIAVNLSLNELKKRKKHTFNDIDSALEKNSEERTTSESEQYEVKELIEKALLKIEPDYRSVVILRLIEGYSTKEVSTMLDIPLGTVLSRLSRGQKKLKTILTPIIK